MTKSYLKELSYKIIGCAIEVHTEIGPGLLESVYEACLVEELRSAGLYVETQSLVPIHYKGKVLSTPLKIDLLVERCVLVELKAVESMIPLYHAQVLSYLQLAKIPKGLLINFNTVVLKDGLTSIVSDAFSRLPS